MNELLLIHLVLVNHHPILRQIRLQIILVVLISINRQLKLLNHPPNLLHLGSVPLARLPQPHPHRLPLGQECLVQLGNYNFIYNSILIIAHLHVVNLHF